MVQKKTILSLVSWLVDWLVGLFQQKCQNKPIVIPKHRGHRLESKCIYTASGRDNKNDSKNEDNSKTEDDPKNKEDPKKGQ